MKSCVWLSIGLLLAFPARAEVPTPSMWFIHGYTDQLSYAPGDTIAFHLSTNLPACDIQFARLGKEKQLRGRSPQLPGVAYPVPPSASSHGCGWPVAYRWVVPADCPTGYYEAYTGANDPAHPDRWVEGHTMFFVVRPAPTAPRNPILLELCTNTYNAYNGFGGQSLYPYNSWEEKPAHRVSFQRPIITDVYRWELPFIKWAEENGYALDYATNADLEFHPEVLEGPRLLVSVGHDEYWSAPMRDHLEAFLDRGGNAAFLSGNSIAWQVRFEENGRAMTTWKRSFREDPLYRPEGPNPLLSTLWSHPLVARPENQVLGVGFLFGGFHKSHDQLMDGTEAYLVHRPDYWVFAGTGLKKGDTFGGASGIVGYECDGCDWVMRDGLPVPTGSDATPENFIILATAPAKWPDVDMAWYEGWKPGQVGSACMGVLTRPGGGTVFTAATTDWAHGLRDHDPVVERITRNVFDRLSR